eukprot:COSAG06_NODE_3785_length_4904_cov_1.736316_1_plen_32_part_10
MSHNAVYDFAVIRIFRSYTRHRRSVSCTADVW